jgi:hypothetical protein
MAGVFQGSLLDLGARRGPARWGTRSAGGISPTAPWVDIRPGWLAGADELFGRLRRAVPWRAERRHMYDRVVDVPRLLCFYGEGEPLPDPALAQARDALNRHYGPGLGEPLCTAGPVPVPGRPGQRRLARGHHGRGATQDTVVAIVSLGPRARSRCGRAAVAPRSAMTLVTAICW